MLEMKNGSRENVSCALSSIWCEGAATFVLTHPLIAQDKTLRAQLQHGVL